MLPDIVLKVMEKQIRDDLFRNPIVGIIEKAPRGDRPIRIRMVSPDSPITEDDFDKIRRGHYGTVREF